MFRSADRVSGIFEAESELDAQNGPKELGNVPSGGCDRLINMAKKGGNAHQRAVERSRNNEQAPVNQPLVNQSPAPHERRGIPTDVVQASLLSILGIVFAVVGLVDIYPLWLNSIFYLLGLLAILWSVSRWERVGDWGIGKKGPILLVVVVVYVLLLSRPVYKQYEKETNINVTFKDSPAFTFGRRQIIRRDLTNVSQYLKDLGVPLPGSLPPLTVHSRSGGGCGETATPNLPLYRAELILSESGVKDREVVTSCYINYVVMNLSLAHLSNGNDIPFVMMVAMGLADYLNTSFWDSKPFGLYSVELWEIRKRLGKGFADRLAGTMLQILSDNPSDARTGTVALDFVILVGLGESVIDGECSHWPTIRQAIGNLQTTQGGPLMVDEFRKRDLSNTHVSSACMDIWKRTN